MKSFDLSKVWIAVNKEIFCRVLGFDLNNQASFSFFSAMIQHFAKRHKWDLTLLIATNSTISNICEQAGETFSPKKIHVDSYHLGKCQPLCWKWMTGCCLRIGSLRWRSKRRTCWSSKTSEANPVSWMTHTAQGAFSGTTTKKSWQRNGLLSRDFKSWPPFPLDLIKSCWKSHSESILTHLKLHVFA